MGSRPNRKLAACVGFLLLVAGLTPVRGFSLLGPFAPWMDATKNFHSLHEWGAADIGGPMAIGEGYRWNVPVVTYGFAPSFLDYFGSNGVAAVEEAIQILNDLPPASAINLYDYRLRTLEVNYVAIRAGLVDLKTAALCGLVEQLGLAQPVRYIFTLRDVSVFGTTVVPETVIRNYDPLTWQPSTFVNGTLYDYEFHFRRAPFFALNQYYSVYADSYSLYGSVAELGTLGDIGSMYHDLSFDDVGGLRYLWHTNNLAWEGVLPGVEAAGDQPNDFVRTAVRPGVEKLTFVPHSFDPVGRQFVPMTNQYVDTYLSNGVAQHQNLQRLIAQPDFLFTCNYQDWNSISPSGTERWVNNGGPGHDGPGVIQPPVTINFNPLGLLYDYPVPYPITDAPVALAWGSFGRTTNAPIVYPMTPPNPNATRFNLWLAPDFYLPYPATGFSWDLTGPTNAVFVLQTSTNLVDWITVVNLTNQARNVTYVDHFFPPNTTGRFFRTVPQ